VPIHKTIEQAAANLEEAARRIIERRYVEAADKVVWAEPAASDQARRNYEDGVMEAIREGRREARIREVGDAAIRKGMKEKGAKVIVSRIIAELGKYRTNFRPALVAAIEAIKAAPPKTRDVRANIETRLMPVVNAMRVARGKPPIM